MLYLIGTGLYGEKDLSLRSLEAIKKCQEVYLENYTNKISFDIKKMEKLIGKNIIMAGREQLENNMEEFVKEAGKKDVALLVIGDPLMATTHMAIVLEAKKRKIEARIIHNASVINAVADTGLSLYNFGKIVSIPRQNKDITSPVEIARQNKKSGMHTLFLLDVNDGCMTVKEAIEYLLDKGIKDEMMIAAAGLGNEKQEIKYGRASKLIEKKFNLEPACLILPGKMHFMEEEAVKQWLI